MTERNPFASPLCVLLPLHSFLLLDSKENEANTHRKKCIHFISWTEKKRNKFFSVLSKYKFSDTLVGCVGVSILTRSISFISFHSTPGRNMLAWEFVSFVRVCVFSFLAILFWSPQYFLLTVVFAIIITKIAALPAWLHLILIEISRLHESITKIRWPGKLNTHWHFRQNNSKKTCAGLLKLYMYTYSNLHTHTKSARACVRINTISRTSISTEAFHILLLLYIECIRGYVSIVFVGANRIVVATKENCCC